MTNKSQSLRAYLALGALAAFTGVAGYLDYTTSRGNYKKVAAKVDSIPSLERANNFREAQRIEDEAWSYIANERKDSSFGVSTRDLDILAERLKSNDTIGSR